MIMSNIMSFVNTFVTEDYFIIFLIIMLLILIVLIMALIKTRNQYYDELGSKFSLEDELLKRMGDTDENINIAKEVLNDDSKVLNESSQNNDAINKDDLVMNSTNKSDEVKEDNTNFYSLIDNYENNDMYMTLIGSAVESGDEGAVGRGNRSRGVIPFCRNFSMEAPCGKNPVYHTGKLFTAIGDKISKDIYIHCY